MRPLPPTSTLFPYTTLFRSTNGPVTIYDTGVWSVDKNYVVKPKAGTPVNAAFLISSIGTVQFDQGSKIYVGFYTPKDRKSTRLNSSHLGISYAVFCLKKKKK